MPARTRTVRAPKASKENVDNLVKTKAKTTGKSTKPVRKPLADKTNSASDENASPEPNKKVIKKSNKPIQKVVPLHNDEDRPRRNRRLPPRYEENEVLNRLSNNKENSGTSNTTPVKSAASVESPFKTPTTVLDNSLLANRPKRVSRLPSRFDENSSPNRFEPTHCHTSTPLVSKAQDNPKVAKKAVGKPKTDTQDASKNIVSSKVTSKITLQRISPRNNTPKKTAQQKIILVTTVPQKVTRQKSPQKCTPKKVTPQKTKVAQKKLVQKKLSEVVKNIDTNLNGRQERVKRLRKPVEYKEDTLSPKIKSPVKEPPNPEGRKILKANSSFRILEEKKSKNGEQDIYEFTFDPTEEPPPQKKKKKKVTAKKPTKPKTRVYNNNYEKNIARALADLKNVVTKQKPENKTRNALNPVQKINNVQQSSTNITTSASNPIGAPNSIIISTVAEIHPYPAQNSSARSNISTVAEIHPDPAQNSSARSNISTVAEIHPDPAQNTSARSNVSTKHVSYRVEDIAADFDASMDHEINYSPVNSPHIIEPEPEDCPANINPEYTNDPLNLRKDLSFFDDQPVANSSMNASKNRNATPWRAEFENLPIKWQANTYVKPDMTPALECSFVNHFDDSKKKHVYTNLVSETNDALLEIDEAPKLKQTSIISFIKEVVEKKANRKKRGVSTTPTKANSLFDMSNVTSKSVATPLKDASGASNNSAENEISNKPQKRKNKDDNNPTPAKLPRKDKESTLFGFDDSENQDIENVSPVKVVNNHRLRSLRSRSGAVLKELNKQTGPMRAELPAAMKAKLAPNSEIVEKIYDQMKSAADAPVMNMQGDAEVTNVEMVDGFEDDSQSVHLFEDIELVHHLKPTRKSYGKAKKVTFQNSSNSGPEDEARNQSSDDDADNLEDLSFHLPQIKAKKATKKKKSKKQLLSKKEKAEADAWAASFNSMCEDIEEFDLVVE